MGNFNGIWNVNLKEYKTLQTKIEFGVLHLTLNRPEVRNAMNSIMVYELIHLFNFIENDRSIRCVVIKGSDGFFCAGADIKEMANADEDKIATINRAFGEMITAVNHTPQVVIAILEGAVMGGGFGLACVTDIGITLKNTKFGLPETTLGLPPAQITPFVVQRIGLTQARALALTGSRFTGERAKELGIVHHLVYTHEDVKPILNKVISEVKNCAPNANAVTKKLMIDAAGKVEDSLLDQAAKLFSICKSSKEGIEGTTAFKEKRKPEWTDDE